MQTNLLLCVASYRFTVDYPLLLCLRSCGSILTSVAVFILVLIIFFHKGGLDDALNIITTLCREQDVPFVFALGRRSLGRACAKLVPVSVVGIFNYQGAEVRSP